MVVLDPGNQSAGHSGSTGGLHIGTLQVTEADETEQLDDKAQGSWIEELDDIDLELD
jgi:hypothetical protein